MDRDRTPPASGTTNRRGSRGHPLHPQFTRMSSGVQMLARWLSLCQWQTLSGASSRLFSGPIGGPNGQQQDRQAGRDDLPTTVMKQLGEGGLFRFRQNVPRVDAIFAVSRFIAALLIE